MTSCNYILLNDLYNAVDANLQDIASKIDNLDLDLKIDELDIDLDEISEQLRINNQLRLLELIGTDIMSEEEQTEAYRSIKTLLFAPRATGGQMEEEEGEF